MFYNLFGKGKTKKDYKQNCRMKFQIIIPMNIITFAYDF